MKEALKLAYDYIDEVDYGPYDSKPVLAAIKAALAQPEQKPVGFVDSKLNPIQRTWVGLTDEDCKGMSAGDKVVAMWADRTLKEKNT